MPQYKHLNDFIDSMIAPVRDSTPPPVGYNKGRQIALNHRMLRIQILSIIFVTIFMIGLIPPTVLAGQDVESSEELFRDPRITINLERVYIFYDPDDPTLREIAEGVDEIVSYRIATVNLIPINSALDLKCWLLDEPWIAVYAFDSNATHVQFNERSIQWYE